MMYLLAFGLAFGLAAALTPVVRQYALDHGVVDMPNDRKIHRRPVAYLGGVAIFGAFLAAALLMVPPSREFGALLLGCTILVLVGVVDDVKGLPAMVKLGWQFVAAGIALAGGIGITAITSPFGGVIDLTWGRFLVDLGFWKFHIMPIANTLSLVWMVAMANTINFLDGLDGLASGISGIAAVVMFVLAVRPGVDQPVVAMIAIIVAGSALGFLPHNFHPARIFMGDSGAYFLGLVLAMLAIYSGAKLATAALVLGVPLVDTVWAVVRRLARGESPFRADRKHFHHLLLDAGLSQRQAVLVLYAVVGLFGLVALMAGSFSKLIALVLLAGLMVVAITWLVRRQRMHVVK